MRVSTPARLLIDVPNSIYPRRHQVIRARKRALLKRYLVRCGLRPGVDFDPDAATGLLLRLVRLVRAGGAPFLGAHI